MNVHNGWCMKGFNFYDVHGCFIVCVCIISPVCMHLKMIALKRQSYTHNNSPPVNDKINCDHFHEVCPLLVAYYFTITKFFFIHDNVFTIDLCTQFIKTYSYAYGKKQQPTIRSKIMLNFWNTIIKPNILHGKWTNKREETELKAAEGY